VSKCEKYKRAEIFSKFKASRVEPFKSTKNLGVAELEYE